MGEKHADTDGWGIDRRSVLKSIGAASVAGIVGIPTFSGGVAAETASEEIPLTWKRSAETSSGVAKSDELAGALSAGWGLSTAADGIVTGTEGGAVWNDDEFFEGDGSLDDITFDFATWDQWDAECASNDSSPKDGSNNSGEPYQMRKFEATFELPDGVSASDVESLALTSPVDLDGEDIIPINDNFYVRLNGGSNVKKGGTADPSFGLSDYGPASRKQDYDTYPGLEVSDGWYFSGDLGDAVIGDLQDGENTLEFVVEEFCNWGGMTRLDLSLEYECSATVDLCAAQDEVVGTLTVTDNDGTLSITYDMDPEAGLLLYETHVDIGGEYDDLHTNQGGNPQVGKFDLSETHDGVTSVEYTVDCDDPAMDDVAEDADTLVIAAHAVVKPTDGCAEFDEFSPGDSVEGMGTLMPNLNIQAGYDEAVAVKEGDEPRIYRAPNPDVEDDQDPVKNWGIGLAKSNGVGGGGFADAKASADDAAQSYTFDFADGVTVNEFSLRMMDYGDYNPTRATSHFAEMVAYDGDGTEVDKQILDYTSNGENVSPVIEDDATYDNNLDQGDDLETDGDAYSTVGDGVEANLGRYTWNVSGDGIESIELSFGKGFDPDVAFDNLCFTAEDETAWLCDDESEEDNVEPFEGSNWATYLEYATCDPFTDCTDSGSSGGNGRGPGGN